MRRNDSGITLLVLVITIIVLTIIASITVYEGKELINKSKIQTLETNMLTIQAKAKAYAEEIDAKVWTKKDEDKEAAIYNQFEKKGFNHITNNPSESNYINQIGNDIDTENCTSYSVSPKGLTDMGLDDIKTESYIVVYDNDDYKKVDIVFPDGVRYNKRTCYTLSEIQKELLD